MSSIICTLFEGHYHYGVAALINSLNKTGFEGEIYAGYRGDLPEWAVGLQNNKDSEIFILQVSARLQIHFLKIETEYHFANYKAQFIITMWDRFAKEAENIFYFDPDIINKCAWSFYEQWVTFGVAVVHELTWNDMPANHPKRRIWSSVADSMNIEISNHLTSNINSGFVGVCRKNNAFLELWCSLVDYSSKYFKLDVSKFCQSNDNHSLFTVADQDLFNLTAMCTKMPLSEMGPEAMDFINGGWTMSHATGSPKPWKKKFIIMALQGMPPSLADKEYWLHANGIIQPYSKAIVAYKKVTIKIASVMGRFYKKY